MSVSEKQMCEAVAVWTNTLFLYKYRDGCIKYVFEHYTIKSLDELRFFYFTIQGAMRRKLERMQNEEEIK